MILTHKVGDAAGNPHRTGRIFGFGHARAAAVAPDDAVGVAGICTGSDIDRFMRWDSRKTTLRPSDVRAGSKLAGAPEVGSHDRPLGEARGLKCPLGRDQRAALRPGYSQSVGDLGDVVPAPGAAGNYRILGQCAALGAHAVQPAGGVPGVLGSRPGRVGAGECRGGGGGCLRSFGSLHVGPSRRRCAPVPPLSGHLPPGVRMADSDLG